MTDMGLIFTRSRIVRFVLFWFVVFLWFNLAVGGGPGWTLGEEQLLSLDAPLGQRLCCYINIAEGIFD
jgi:hypothetical protein